MPAKPLRVKAATGRRWAAVLAFVCSLVGVLAVPAGAQDEPAGGRFGLDPSLLALLAGEDEALLNSLRCWFDVDTEVVPGGCSNGRPAARPATGAEPETAVVGGEDLVQCSGSQLCLVSISDRSGWEGWCGLLSDRTVVCTNFDESLHPPAEPPSVPAGRFQSVSAGLTLACGLREDHRVECWNNHWQPAEVAPPAGRFTSVSAGIAFTEFACGIREDHTAVCWGDSKGDRTGRLDAPKGRFTSVSAGWEHACGIREDQTVVCWGDNKHGRLEVPEGRFASVSAGFWFSCGIREDRTATCWGNNLRRGYNAPQGRFASVSAGQGLACGLREDHTAVCWGPPDTGRFGELDPPTGRFHSISVGPGKACGIRPDGTLECWGLYAEAWPTVGSFDVHVAYCARQDKYTQADLEELTDQFNQIVAPFYAQESSGLVQINFIAAGIASPDIDWKTALIGSSTRFSYKSRCLTDIQQLRPDTDYEHVLILMDARVGDAFGHASSGGTSLLTSLPENLPSVAVAATVESLSSWFDENRWGCPLGVNCREYVYWRFLRVVAHELGHSLFDFGHPRDCSLMSVGNDIGCQPISWATAMQTSNPLQARSFIGCADRRIVGWPQDPARCPGTVRFSV